jgi:hypothetical protein
MSSWDGNIINESHKLNNTQVVRLLAMTELLRDRANLNQVWEIKMAIIEDRDDDARALWSDFTEDEQTTLWVAPMYGGIFTTEERKRLRPQEK